MSRIYSRPRAHCAEGWQGLVPRTVFSTFACSLSAQVFNYLQSRLRFMSQREETVVLRRSGSPGAL